MYGMPRPSRRTVTAPLREGCWRVCALALSDTKRTAITSQRAPMTNQGAPASCRLARRHLAAGSGAAGCRPASRLEGGAPALMRMYVIVTMLVLMVVTVGMPFHSALHLLHDLPGDLPEGLGGNGVGLGDDDRLAAVAADDHARVDRYLAEEGHAEHLGRPFPAAMTEDLLTLAAVLADEVAHVLDDAEERHVHLAEHGQALARVDKGDVLRGRHNDGAGQRDALGERELGIACAGRKVEDHGVERAPLHVGEELVERLHHHRPAPDHRSVGIGDEAEGHGLDAMVLHRQDLLVGLVDDRRSVNAEHHLLRRTVDVGVEQADRIAEGPKSEGEIGRHGRLTDAALPRGHGELVRYPRQHLRTGAGHSGGLLARGDVDGDAGLGYAGDGAHGRFRFAGDLLSDLRILALETDDQRDLAAVDLDVVDEVERDDVAREAGELDPLQRLNDLFLSWGWHSASPV